MDFAPAYPDARSTSSRSDHHRQQLYSVLPQQQQQQYYSSEDNSPSSPSASPSSWQQQLSNTDQARVAIRQQYHQYQSEQQERHVKRESHQHDMAYNVDEKSASVAGSSAQPPTLPSQQPRAAEDPMPSTSDFVKKLYKMLEDPSFQSVVCWGPLGDCFVVKDMNEFTKSILPRMFKHSNFASFVRQLNKYDFHKVKNTDDNQFGEHSWTFRHPDFHADRRDALENIKRKVPAQRKYTPAASATVANAAPASASAPYPPPQGAGSSYPYPSSSAYPSGPLHTVGGRRSPSPTRAHLTAEIQRLKDEGDDLRGRIRNLERNYENVLVELVSFQRGMAQQDGLMQSLIGWFLEGGKGPLPKASISAPPSQHASLMSSPMDMENQLQASTSSTGTPQGGLVQDLQQQQQPESHSAKLRQYLQAIHAQQQAAGVASSGSSSGIFPAFAPSSLTDPGLFLPPQAVRGQGDIGRATLMQMSELSRRATLGGAGPTTGWGPSGSFPDGVGSAEVALPQQQQAPSADISAGPRSRGDHFAQLREYYNQRQGEAAAAAAATVQGGSGAGWAQQSQQGESSLARSTGFNESREREMPLSGAAGVTDMNYTATDDARGRRPRRSDSGAPFTNRVIQDQQSQQQQQQQQQSQNPSPSGSWTMLSPPGGLSQYDSSSPQSASLRQALGPALPDEVMTHEGLQVYTVGHLLPRNTYIEDSQGNWSFDPSALTASSSSELSNGLGGVDGAPASRQGQTYGSSEDVDDADEVVRPTPPAGSSLPPAMASLQAPSSGTKSGATQQKLRVRRSTFVPGWAVPPRVLLVDDDAVSRKLSSKFLKVFGCTTDVAVDGVGAVNKMNLEKYDLVLMDIVMPKLDGVSATNLIRKFDQGTPIISMTSNSKPNEIMTYYSSGMNDILPKPFTKEGLLDMLEKHLMHLKVIQQMSKLSRTVGIPPLSDTNFEQAVRQGANNLLMPPPSTPSSSSSAVVPLTSSNASTPNAPSPFNFQFFGDGTDDTSDMGRVNPLAGMGLSDEQYNVILQNIVNGDGFMGMMDGLDGSGMGTSGSEKRGLEDGEDERGGKRSRFEVVE